MQQPKWIKLRREEEPLPGPLAFYIPDSRLLGPVEELRGVAAILDLPGLAAACMALDANLHAAVDIAATPGALVVAARRPERFAGTDPLDLLRDLARPVDLKGETPDRHLEVSFDRLAAYLELTKVSQRREVVRHVNEALRQATVLLWVAFEAVANDSLEMLIAARPSLLCGQGEHAKKLREAYWLGERQWSDSESAEALAAWRKRGRRVQNLRALKKAIGAALPDNPELRSMLGNRHLALVSVRRNVVAHQAGVFDAKAVEELSKLGERAAVGQLLRIEPREFDRQAAVVAMAALEIVKACVDDVRAGSASRQE